jgi:hypothetical protein
MFELVVAIAFIGYIGYYFQGPAATIVIITAWFAKLRDRKKSSSSPGSLRKAILWGALAFTTVAVLLDWAVLYAEYLQHYGQPDSFSTEELLDTLEPIPKIVSVISAFAIALALIGQGKGRWRTLITAILLIIGSLALMFLRSCRSMSF